MQGDAAVEDVNALLTAPQRAKLWLCERFLKVHPHRWFTLPEIDLHVPRGVPISQFPLGWLQGMLKKTAKNQFQCWRVVILPAHEDTIADNGDTSASASSRTRAIREGEAAKLVDDAVADTADDDDDGDAPKRIPSPERVQLQYAPIHLESSNDVAKAVRAATRITDQGVLGIGGENLVPTPRAVECVEAALRQNSVVMMRKDHLGKELKESMLAMARLGGRGMETESIVEFGQRGAAGSPATGAGAAIPVGSASAASASRGFGNNSDFADILTSDAKTWFQECPVRFWFSVRDPIRGTTYSQAGIPTLFTPGVVYTLSVQRRLPSLRPKPTGSASASKVSDSTSSNPSSSKPQATEAYSLTKMLDAVFAAERPVEEEDLAETLQHYPLQVALAVQGSRGRGNQILSSITLSQNAIRFEPLSTTTNSTASAGNGPSLMKQPRVQHITIEARESCKGHFMLQIQPLPATTPVTPSQPTTAVARAGGGGGTQTPLLRDPSKLLRKSQTELPIPFEVLRRSLLVNGETSLKQFVFYCNESTPTPLAAMQVPPPSSTAAGAAAGAGLLPGLINPEVVQQCLQQHLLADPEQTRPSGLDTALEHLEAHERKLVQRQESSRSNDAAASPTISAPQILAKKIVSDAVALRWADYPSPTFAMAKLSVATPSAEQLAALAGTMFVDGTKQQQQQQQQNSYASASQKVQPGKRKRGRGEGDGDGGTEGKPVVSTLGVSSNSFRLQAMPIRLRNHHMKNRGFVFTEPYVPPSMEGGVKLQPRSRRTD